MSSVRRFAGPAGVAALLALYYAMAVAAVSKKSMTFDEMALMEEFRLLSERHAAGLIDDAGYQAERHRLFVDLGIETEDEV